ncbi:uncharacterized protein RAG0_14848 [Rhynchosporium agropyri]|uniref:Rhodopsin domain-containing protein n=1 Tax=Rhynchosporium agropyri TaxID=914238 RepID=A0A1E1LKN9_9HELO|nr:uncharacterized protein RAG0_14848 [Rhynchosporium agropyri]
MASNGTMGLSNGQSEPLTIITSTDQSGVILIVTALGLAFAIVSIFIRIYIQFGLRTAADGAAVIYMIFYMFHGTAIFIAATKGFGKTFEHIPENQLTIYSSDILYIMTFWFTKCSVALLLVRLSPDRRHNFASFATLGTSTIFMIASVLIISLRSCSMADSGEHGYNYRACLVQHLHLSSQRSPAITTEKTAGSFCFRSSSANDRTNNSSPLQHSCSTQLSRPNTGRHNGNSIHPNRALLRHYSSHIALSPTCVMNALSTHYGTPASLKITPNDSNTYSLNSNSTRSKVPRTEVLKLGPVRNDQYDIPVLRWDKTTHHASVVGGDQQSKQSHESEQMIISKNTQWAVDFEDGKETES